MISLSEFTLHFRILNKLTWKNWVKDSIFSHF